jgi:hypothetical protein
MKTNLPYLAVLAFAGSAFAGETVVTSRTTYQSSESASSHACGRFKNAGTPGAFYHSNFSRNAVLLCNDTPDFMTFFVYSGDVAGPNDINHMIRIGAQVYEIVVPPYRRSYTDQRGRHYWVGSKRGKWGIDLATHQIVPW